MRYVIYTNMISLDGYMEDANGSLDWVTMDEELHRFVNERERETGAFLYGRRTNEVMAAFWPAVTGSAEYPPYIVAYAQIWQSIPRYIFSRTLHKVDRNATLMREVSVKAVEDLKAQPGGNLEIGGATLAASFMQLGLIEEYRVYVHPTLLGAGNPMFPKLNNAIRLRLLESHVFGSGVVYLRYRVAQAA